MKTRCNCGATIHDVTDAQENKAHFIPDQSWEVMHDSIAAGNSSWDACANARRVMYQCVECSRIYLQNQSGDFVSFIPEGPKRNGILKRT